MCVIAVVAAAPCQCFSPGGIQITSPGRICSIGAPQRWARPEPAVTIRVWPSGCVCQAVRAPGSNVTLAQATRAGSGAWNSGSIRTVPVNQSAGPSPDGCEPIRLISIYQSDRLELHLRMSLACQAVALEGWSRVTFSFDLHDFRGASILKRNPVVHVRGKERFADRRNPTDGVRFEIEFVNTDDGIGFGPAFFIFYCHRCAEGNAVRCRVRRIDNVDRCQNLFQFGHALAVRVCCAKFLQFVAQMLRAARGDVIGRARGQSRHRSLPSAALRKIDIFFDERPAHSKEYRTTVAFSVSDFAQPMSNV